MLLNQDKLAVYHSLVGRGWETSPEQRQHDTSESHTFVILKPRATKEDGGGRCVAMEILRNTSGVGNVIRTMNLSQVYSMLETQKKEGMQTMEQHLVELYAEGVISYENAVNFANDLSILDQLKDYEDEDDY